MNSSRNTYRQGRIDFAKLAEVDEEFAQYHDFTQGHAPERKVRGLDIGTGASCIYPLLGRSARPTWKFIATELDEKNYEWALSNIERNNLQSGITLIKRTTPYEPLLAGVLEGGSLDFTMCNPPFYTSESEMLHLAELKTRAPFSACTGVPVEMICTGGELYFITRIINESMQEAKKTKIQWFTAMCGKFESVGRVLEILKNKGCENVAVREFVNQTCDDGEEEEEKEKEVGRKKKVRTKRWGVAWSWMDLRPGMETARNNISSKIPKHLLPFPSEYTFTCTLPSTSHQQGIQAQAEKRVKTLDPDSSSPSKAGKSSPVEELIKRLNSALNPLDMHWQWNVAPERVSVVGWSNGDVWSRKARRAKKRGNNDDGDDSGKVESKVMTPRDAKFGVRIEAFLAADEVTKEEIKGNSKALGAGSKRPFDENNEDQEKTTEIKIRWLKGADGVLFESFCGMVKRKTERD
ncbi:hypothetical protein KEM56_006203 [Ascosphaera pollenicola]|nr:hypothetical protein KEM56_006203 [Ascosphaera pollenicola]